MTKVSTEKIDGVEIEFNVDKDGKFTAYIEAAEEGVAANTLMECRAKARTKLRRALASIDIKASIVGCLPVDWVNIPRWQRESSNREIPDDNQVRPITIIGLHPRNHTVLVVYEDTGERDEFRERHWSDDKSGRICRRLTSADVKEFQRLYAERKAAMAAFEKWMKEHQIDRVEDFIEAKVQEKINATNEGTPEESEDPRITEPTKKRKRG